MNLKSLAAILPLCLSAHGMESEIWISPYGPVNASATGTASTPFRCPTPANLAAQWRKLPNQPLTIHLMAGAFEVASPGLEVQDGWKIRGAGVDSTIVQLVTNAAPGAAVTLFYSDLCPGAEVSDLTIDCNYQNQILPHIVNAISISGSNTRINRVKAINWGISTGGENFILAISNDGWNDAINCVIEDCIVTQPAPVLFNGGVTALSIWTKNGQGNGRVTGAIYRNNFVYGVECGTGRSGSPQYFHGMLDGSGGMVINNFFTDLIGPGARGIYRDSFDDSDDVIQGNVMNNVRECIYFNMTAAHMQGLVIQGNVLRPSEGGSGITYTNGDGSNTNAYAMNLVAANNVIYPASGTTNARAMVLRTGFPNIVSKNVLQGGGTLGDVGITPARRGTNQFVGNMNFSGPLTLTNTPVPIVPTNSVKLSWDASTGPVTHYVAWWGIGPSNYLWHVSTPDLSVVIANLTPGVQYHFSVAAADAQNKESAFNNDVAYTLP